MQPTQGTRDAFGESPRGGGLVWRWEASVFVFFGGGVAVAVLSSHHTAQRPAQACWFYLLSSNTLPLILLWFCFCLCGIGALEAGTLLYTNAHTQRACSTWAAVLLMQVYFPSSAVRTCLPKPFCMNMMTVHHVVSWSAKQSRGDRVPHFTDPRVRSTSGFDE